MRAAVLALALGLVAGCTSQVSGKESSPQSDCEALVDVVCGKYFECFSSEERAAAGVPATEESCVDSTRADFECAGQSLDTACPAGQTYDPAAAAACLNEHAALSCDAIRTDLEDSDTPSCATVCR
jgi:hypothetical protein